jgi:hypothetical protein
MKLSSSECSQSLKLQSLGLLLKTFQNKWSKRRPGLQVHLLDTILTLELFQGLDEGKAKMMAGGILIKLKEIVTKHERLLLGDIISVGSISSAPMGLKFR